MHDVFLSLSVLYSVLLTANQNTLDCMQVSDPSKTLSENPCICLTPSLPCPFKADFELVFPLVDPLNLQKT